MFPGEPSTNNKSALGLTGTDTQKGNAKVAAAFDLKEELDIDFMNDKKSNKTNEGLKRGGSKV